MSENIETLQQSLEQYELQVLYFDYIYVSDIYIKMNNGVDIE